MHFPEKSSIFVAEKTDLANEKDFHYRSPDGAVRAGCAGTGT